MDQRSNVTCDGWIRNCPGVGAWFTSTRNVPNDLIGSVGSRLEYNVNNGQLWFNSSAVDAINANFDAYYTGCPETERICNIDFSGCVKGKDHGVTTCLAPKFWNNEKLKKCGTNGFTGHNIKNVKDLAGCGFGDSDTKKLCHKWWANNKCAQEWLNFIQKNKKGRCDLYGWAYDEKKYIKGVDTFDLNGNPCKTNKKNGEYCEEQSDNPVSPLIHCPINKGSLNISILSILE